MKILMIDDEKCPSEFKKNKNEKFSKEEVTLCKNYADGMTQLIENGPWDILLLDWNLKEFSPRRNGELILNSIFRYKLKVNKIILITADEKKAQVMAETCKELKKSQTINEFEIQTPKGW